MIAPDDIDIVVFAWRARPVAPLQAWLDVARDAGAEIRTAPESRPVWLAREQAANGFLARTAGAGVERYLLMIDHDVVPAADAAGILTEPGELLYCGLVGQESTCGHYGDVDFGCACCRISADALARIPKPWFRFCIGADVLLACECNHFRRQANEAGVVQRMVGTVWHQQTIYVRPADAGQVVTAWPSKVLEEVSR